MFFFGDCRTLFGLKKLSNYFGNKIRSDCKLYNSYLRIKRREMAKEFIQIFIDYLLFKKPEKVNEQN